MAVRHCDAAGTVRHAARVLVPTLWLAAACGTAPTLSAYWTGSDTGKAVLPARAALCGQRGPLLIFAQSGDTGIGLAIYPMDSLVSGHYTVFDPLQGSVRPGAAVAARWTRKMVMADLRGFQGQLSLDQAGPVVAGHFSARTTGVVMSASIAMEGSFRGIPVVAGGTDCAGQSR